MYRLGSLVLGPLGKAPSVGEASNSDIGAAQCVAGAVASKSYLFRFAREDTRHSVQDFAERKCGQYGGASRQGIFIIPARPHLVPMRRKAAHERAVGRRLSRCEPNRSGATDLGEP
jgi:hypothetical protein